MKSIKLKVNHINKNSSSFIQDYLGTLGIAPQDVDSFINLPRNSDEEDPLHLDNMQAAVDYTYNYISQNPAAAKIFIQIDADTDGFTSASILFCYLKKKWPQLDIQYNLHPGKEHGIVLESIGADRDLIFIPDAGSNDLEQQKTLTAQGKKVIILDHHEVEKPEEAFNTCAIIVNNQTSKNFINKSLSGAGVVYKFIKQMDRQYFDGQTYHQYGDLAAIGIIADAMNMTTLDNNYIAWYGLSNIHSKFINALAKRQSRGIKNPDSLTKIDVAFYIAPIINGVIRSGTMEDKEIVFKALIDENNQEDFEHTWRGTVYHETLYEYAARIAANAKSRQDAAKKKSFEWLCNTVRANGLDKNNIIVVALNDKDSSKVNPNITGLIAMELVKEFNKPCLVLRQTEYEGQSAFAGSGRNGNFYGLSNLKDFVQTSGALYAAGHAGAFGVFLTAEQIEHLKEYSNSHLLPSAFDLVYEVDYWFHTGERIDANMLMTLAEYDWLWGNSIPQPKFAFSLTITKDQIRFMGKDNSSIKISVDGVDFVCFGNEELNRLIHEASGNTFIHLDFVGRAQINEWMGHRKVQVIIDDFTVFNQQSAPKIALTDLI